MSLEQIQQLYAIPQYTPGAEVYVSVGGVIAAGSTVNIGIAGKNAFGTGGGLQVEGTNISGGNPQSAESFLNGTP